MHEYLRKKDMFFVIPRYWSTSRTCPFPTCASLPHSCNIMCAIHYESYKILELVIPSSREIIYAPVVIVLFLRNAIESDRKHFYHGNSYKF